MVSLSSQEFLLSALKWNMRIAFLFLLLIIPSYGQPNYGHFEGQVQAQWIGGGREMKLLQDFVYIAPDGVRWVSPAGSVVDGASIPRIAWTIIGGPYEGSYREASVIHDVACDMKEQAWEDVHNCFYWAMLAGGTDRIKAKIMYAAVWYGGPRWPRKVRMASVPFNPSIINERASQLLRNGETFQINLDPDKTWNPNKKDLDVDIQVQPKPSKLSDSDLEAIKKAIEQKDLSLEEIRNYKFSQ